MKYLAILFLVLVVSGCVSIDIDDQEAKIHTKATSFLTKSAIKDITVTSKDGYRRTIKGAESDQVAAIQAMTDLINSAAAAGAKAAAK